MISRDQAMNERNFHEEHEAGGKVYNWRRNGATKTWKKEPERWEIPVKYGLYSYDRISNRDAEKFHVPGEGKGE